MQQWHSSRRTKPRGTRFNPFLLLYAPMHLPASPTSLRWGDPTKILWRWWWQNHQQIGHSHPIIPKYADSVKDTPKFSNPSTCCTFQNWICLIVDWPKGIWAARIILKISIFLSRVKSQDLPRSEFPFPQTKITSWGLNYQSFKKLRKSVMLCLNEFRYWASASYVSQASLYLNIIQFLKCKLIRIDSCFTPSEVGNYKNVNGRIN